MQQSLAQFFVHIKKVGFSEKLLYILSLMLFFWALFDGLLGYLVPIVITGSGMSKTEMGIIFGSSSVFGAAFDFIFSKYFHKIHFRRIYLLLFALCFVYPLILWTAKGVWLFLIAMAVWGFYYDLENFGNFDFVGRGASEDDNVHHFGIISVFKALGYLIAPLIAGLLIGEASVGWQPYVFSWVILSISFVLLIVLLFVGKRRVNRVEQEVVVHRKVNVFREASIWQGIGKILLPVLFLTIFLNILDAFFWTIGPLLAESFGNLHPFNGLFMTMYELPPLLVGWFVGRATNIFGKKKTAFLSFGLGCLLLAFLPFLHSPYFILALVFLASLFFGLATPSISGAYSDYIKETSKYEKEIEGLEDFSTNVGYIIGPVLAGFLADQVGNMQAFSVFAGIGIIVALVLLKFTPKSITVEL